MQLFLFKTKLVFHLVIFILNLFFFQTKKAKPFLLAIFIILFILSMILLYFIKNKITNKEIKSDSVYTPTRSDLYIKSEKTKEEITKELTKWEAINTKQPNSRDVLINISNLKKLLGQDDEANSNLNKAKLIDPNNSVFQN